MNSVGGVGLLRERSEGGERVTHIELFFDLVYVFAVTQLARLLLEHLNALGAAQTLLLLLAVWRAWIDMAFAGRGLVFAGAYVAMQVGKPAFAVAALGSDPKLRRNFQRILVWCAASGTLWLAGGFAVGTTREAL
jgi:low temperature requirement protein LtrA